MDDRFKVASFLFELHEDLQVGYSKLMKQMLDAESGIFLGSMKLNAAVYRVLRLQHPVKKLSDSGLELKKDEAKGLRKKWLPQEEEDDAFYYFEIILHCKDHPNFRVSLKILCCNLNLIAMRVWNQGVWTKWFEFQAWCSHDPKCKYPETHLQPIMQFDSAGYTDLLRGRDLNFIVDIMSLREAFYNIVKYCTDGKPLSGHLMVKLIVLFCEGLRFRSVRSAIRDVGTYLIDADLLRDWSSCSNHLIQDKMDTATYGKNYKDISVLLAEPGCKFVKDPAQPGFVLLKKS